MDAQTLATEIVRKIARSGYTAYFAGGWVRDFLMGHPSEDIDIATDAPPEKILDLFPHTILVGLAFGVIIVIVNGHQFEIATFRRDIAYEDGRKPTHIELSTPEEDASRRDFTINGMFYDPLEGIVHDFVKGAEDLKLKIIRTIGDPYERFFEDRLRMIRAVRFSARFGFSIENETQEAIRANAYSLFPAVAMERVWQEFSKMSKYPNFDVALGDLHRLELLPTIFPSLKGIHLHEIRKRVSHFALFPKPTNTILYLIELFPQASKEEAIDLCRYLRTSVSDAQLAAFLVNIRQAVWEEDHQNRWEKVQWVYLYSHPAAWLCLEIIAAAKDPSARHTFLQKHQERMKNLALHISRIVQKKPLVNATHLLKLGIPQGKIIGFLLKQAERIAIEQDITSAENVLELLRKTPYWISSKEIFYGK